MKNSPVSLFSLKDLFSREELNQFRNCSKFYLIFDLILVWLQAITGVLIIVFTDNLFLIAIGVFIVGSAQHGMGLITHEGAHTLLDNSRIHNDFIARWFFAAPVLLPFSLYRRRHFHHHQFACTDSDTKELYKQKISRFYFIIEIMKSLTGIDFLKQVISVLRGLWRGPKNASSHPGIGPNSILFDFFSILIVQLVLLIVFLCSFGWSVYLLAWIVPMVTVNILCGKLRSIVEHQPLSKDSHGAFESRYFKGMNAPFTRSISPTLLERFFLTKINFSYHAEHHLFPSVSYQFLPLVRERISLTDKNILFKVGYSHEHSYFKVLRSLVFDNN